MYIISKENNRIKRIDSKTFKELGYKEKENLQGRFEDGVEELIRYIDTKSMVIPCDVRD